MTIFVLALALSSAGLPAAEPPAHSIEERSSQPVAFDACSESAVFGLLLGGVSGCVLGAVVGGAVGCLWFGETGGSSGPYLPAAGGAIIGAPVGLVVGLPAGLLVGAFWGQDEETEAPDRRKTHPHETAMNY